MGGAISSASCSEVVGRVTAMAVGGRAAILSGRQHGTRGETQGGNTETGRQNIRTTELALWATTSIII